MNHDELMSALNIGITMTGNRLATHEEDALLYRKALRAVVELHKPHKYSFKGIQICSVCEAADDDGQNWTSRVVYPCPTIQIIEKELS